MKPIAVGVDFGTTNTVVALADGEGAGGDAAVSDPQRSRRGLPVRAAVLSPEPGRRSRISHVSGPDALSRALEADSEHRFLQSLKTYLSSRAFEDTRLLGRRFALDELISHLFGRRADAGAAQFADRRRTARGVRRGGRRTRWRSNG